MFDVHPFPMSFASIAIIGAGAVGGYYGGRLAEHGREVHFLLRSDYEHVRVNGLIVRSCRGDFSLPAKTIHAYNDAAAMPKVDLVIVTLKSTENHRFRQLIAPLLREETAILTLQNGLGNEDDLAELFGAGRVVGGIAFTCINRISPGVIEHTSHGRIRLGDFKPGDLDSGDFDSGDFNSPSRSARAEVLAEMFNASNVEADVLDDLRRGRWEKLVWNVPFNGLGALHDLTTDRLIDSESGVARVMALMNEVIAAARVDGVTLPGDLPEKMIATTRSAGAYRTSMQLDRQAGRSMEIEAIVGRPLQVARRGGLASPLLNSLYLALSCG
jgi:2-dehydropantoate 2-reductase